MHARILIVEDDPLVAMMLEEYLELLERRPASVVDNVSAALDVIAAGEIDAAIVDVHLANGETAEPVAAALAARTIPFLIATGGFVRPPGAAFAGRPVLLKPFTFASIEAALVQLDMVGTAT